MIGSFERGKTRFSESAALGRGAASRDAPEGTHGDRGHGLPLRRGRASGQEQGDRWSVGAHARRSKGGKQKTAPQADG